MDGHVHGVGEAVGRTIDHPAMQVRGGRVADRMQGEVQASPLRRDLVEHDFEFAGNADVDGHGDFALQRRHQRADVGFGFLAEVGDGEIGAGGAEMTRAAGGEAALVRHADHEPLFALQRHIAARAVGYRRRLPLASRMSVAKLVDEQALRAQAIGVPEQWAALPAASSRASGPPATPRSKTNNGSQPSLRALLGRPGPRLRRLHALLQGLFAAGAGKARGRLVQALRAGKWLQGPRQSAEPAVRSVLLPVDDRRQAARGLAARPRQIRAVDLPARTASSTARSIPARRAPGARSPISPA